MKSVKEHMDMQDAYREVGSDRSAGIICGVSAESAKQSVLAAANPDGGPTPGEVRHSYDNVADLVAEPLGIPKGDGFHQLRHFYASLLIHKEESVKVIQKRLGHQSTVLTLDTYGHLWPDSEEATRVDEAFLGLIARSAHAGTSVSE